MNAAPEKTITSAADRLPPLISPLTSALLSCLCSGLGQMHCGRMQRGLGLFVVSLLFLPVTMALSSLPPSNTRLALLLLSACVVLLVMVGAVVDAWRCARHASHNAPLSPLLSLALVVVGLGFPYGSFSWLRSHAFEAFRYVEHSMSPTLADGDRLLVNHATLLNRPLQRGDLVAFRSPTVAGQTWIKRVAGLPGDRVSIRDGQLFLSQVSLSDPTRQGGGLDSGRAIEHTTGHSYSVLLNDGPGLADHAESVVSPGTIFVLGDNRNRSLDSRHFGDVPRDLVVGIVEYLFYPEGDWSRWGVLGP